MLYEFNAKVKVAETGSNATANVIGLIDACDDNDAVLEAVRFLAEKMGTATYRIITVDVTPAP